MLSQPSSAPFPHPRIALLSPKDKTCGIAKYTRILYDELRLLGLNAEIIPFPSDEMLHAKSDARTMEIIASLGPVLAAFDIIHFQHEFSFFHRFGKSLHDSQLTYLEWVRFYKKTHRIFTTFHTSPNLQSAPIKRTLRPHKLAYRLYKKFLVNRRLNQISSEAIQDTHLIVHSETSRRATLATSYCSKAIIHLMEIPIQVVHRCSPEKERALQKNVLTRLHIQDDSIILGISGFVNEYKGHRDALLAMKILPDHYKLLVIGGKHPRDEGFFAEEFNQLIVQLGLKSRVFITGVFEDDEYLSYAGLVKIMLAPYKPGFNSSSGAITLSMQAKRPIIASKIKAFCDLKSSADIFEFTPPNDPRQLAKKIVALNKNPGRSEALAASITTYLNNNLPRKFAQTHAALYAQSLSTSRQLASV